MAIAKFSLPLQAKLRPLESLLAQPPNCNRHYLALKKFQSEFKYGEPFRRQVGAWKRPCFPMVRYQPLREVVDKEPHQHVWNSCAIIEP